MKIRAITTANRNLENTVLVEISGTDVRHLVRGGKEIEYKDLYWDEMRLADDALDDLYELPLFDGERIMSSDTAYIIAWQTAKLVEEEEENQ